VPSDQRPGIAAFAFNTGQFCMSGSRLLVERSVYEIVVGALGGSAPHFPVDGPFAEGTAVGPFHTPAVLVEVEQSSTFVQDEIFGPLDHRWGRAGQRHRHHHCPVRRPRRRRHPRYPRHLRDRRRTADGH
jgi:hypothetical protein